MSVTPSLPQRGKQPKGSAPLTPFFSGIFSLNFSINLIQSCRNMGDAHAAGVEAQKRRNPQERKILEKSF